MRTRRLTYAELSQKADRLESDRSLLSYAIGRIMTESPDATRIVTEDGFRYTLKAYRLTGPHGGIVAIVSHYLSGQQADSVIVEYLDRLSTSEAYTYAYRPRLCRAFGALVIDRQRAIDAERVQVPA